MKTAFALQQRGYALASKGSDSLARVKTANAKQTNAQTNKPFEINKNLTPLESTTIKM